MRKYSKLLSKLYYESGKPYAYSSVKKLFLEAKKHNSNITLKDVKHWITTQEIPSRFSHAKRKFKRPIFAISEPHRNWMADLAFFRNLARENDRFQYLLIISDQFSRRILGCIALKGKTALEVGKGLERVIHELNIKPMAYITDLGGEFVNPKLYEKYGISHRPTLDTSQKVAIIERQISVVKAFLYKQMAKDGSNRWIDKLQSVITAYNNSPNRNLGNLTPLQASEPRNKAKVFLKSVVEPETKRMSAKPPKFKYSIGQNVRIQMSKDAFGKAYLGNYSQVIYTIFQRKMKVGAIPSYRIREVVTQESVSGYFYEPELKPVYLDPKKPVRNDIQKIHSFRLSPTNVTQVKVSFTDGPKQRTWLDYNDLLNYEK